MTRAANLSVDRAWQGAWQKHLSNAFLLTPGSVACTKFHDSATSFSLLSKEPPQTQCFYISQNHKSTAPNPMTQQLPFHCSPRAHPQIQCLYFLPRPASQQHPTPRVNNFLLTAGRRPIPDSMILHLPKTRKSTVPHPMIRQLPSHCSSRI